MKFLTFLLTIITTAMLTAASPITKRQLGGVLICNGANATGNCTYGNYTLDTCYDLPDSLAGDAATFAPDGEAFYCYPYLVACDGVCMSPEGCTLGAVSYNSTDKWNLTAAGGWNELIESFECHAGIAPSYTVARI